MSDPRTARARPPGDSGRALRLLGLAAVAAGVLLLAAAAFVLSYAGMHAVALSAGVSPRLARLYPVIFDAMLVVACAAILSLRRAGRPSRCYAWLTLLLLLAAAAGADTVHATGASLPHKPAAAAAAIIPWALLLIGFGLLLSMLRQARLRLAGADDDEGLVEPSGRAEVTGGIDALLGPRPSPGLDVPPGRNGFPAPAESAVPNGSPGPEASAQSPRTREQQPAGYGHPNGGAASTFSPASTLAPGDAGTGEQEADAESKPESASEPETEAGPEPEPAGVEPEMAGTEPVAGDQPEASPAPALAAAQFDRMRSSPVAPEA